MIFHDFGYFWTFVIFSTVFKIIHLFNKMSLKDGRHGFRNLRCCTFEWWYFSQHMLTFLVNKSSLKCRKNMRKWWFWAHFMLHHRQHWSTWLVLTKSMMHQLSKTVSNVSQLFLDHFITFCKETTYFQAKVVLKIGRCQLFR